MQGRILVFSAADGKLSLVSEKEARGGVYCVLPFQGMLLAGINSRVQLYRCAQLFNDIILVQLFNTSQLLQAHNARAEQSAGAAYPAGRRARVDPARLRSLCLVTAAQQSPGPEHRSALNGALLANSCISVQLPYAPTHTHTHTTPPGTGGSSRTTAHGRWCPRPATPATC